jgi:endonuclease-3
MRDPETVQTILAHLDTLYPWEGRCFLHYETPWQLLFATILSAQCTDDRVNQITAELYKKYADLNAFVKTDIEELESDIRPAGFFHMKAAHIQGSAQMLLSEYGGEVPSDMESLTKLPGVGRKTANVLLSHVFQTPSIVVDTHVKRVSFRLGLTRYTDPEKIEYELMEVLPQSHWIRYNQQIITHGRQVCKARSPRCGECALRGCCHFAQLQ